jgi:hypothetical protein
VNLKNTQPDAVRRYFSKFLLLVLARPTIDGQFDVSGDMAADGRTIGCYLNPVTAWVDATQFAKAGQSGYQLKSVGSFDRRLFYNANTRCLMADVRTCWAVHNRKIILRPDLGLVSITKPIRLPVPHGAELPASFEVDQDAFKWLDDIHERAGLFAWRETVRAVGSWEAARVASAAECALATIEVTVCDASLCDELALFDPEGGQWHFVPAADFLKR